MKKLKFAIIFIYIIIGLSSLNGQALHFSQIFHSPLNLNPALTGVIDANWRLISNYRSQGTYFSKPLNTISVAFDNYIENSKGKIGVGVLYNHDSSQGVTIPADQFYVSGSGITQISENSFASVGIQLGFVWRRISYNGVSFPEQYDREIGDFNPNLPLSENYEQKSELYPDINAGALWWMQKGNTKIMSGASVYHINNPTDNFLTEESKAGVRGNVHGSLEYVFNSMYYLQTQVYYTQQRKANEILFGALGGLRVKSSKLEKLNELKLGVYIRNNFTSAPESAIVSLGTSFSNWTAFLSTDFEISGLKTKNLYTNAIEFTFIYHRPFANLKRFTLPCIRY